MDESIAVANLFWVKKEEIKEGRKQPKQPPPPPPPAQDLDPTLHRGYWPLNGGYKCFVRVARGSSATVLFMSARWICSAGCSLDLQ